MPGIVPVIASLHGNGLERRSVPDSPKILAASATNYFTVVGMAMSIIWLVAATAALLVGGFVLLYSLVRLLTPGDVLRGSERPEPPESNRVERTIPGE